MRHLIDPPPSGFFDGRDASEPGLALRFVSTSDMVGIRDAKTPHLSAWLRFSGFGGGAGEILALADDRGIPGMIMLGIGDADANDPAAYAASVRRLPPGRYRLHAGTASLDAVAIGWAMGSLGRADGQDVALAWPDGLGPDIARIADAERWTRDLINLPGGELGPDALAARVADLARRHGAAFDIVRGQALVEQGLPGIFAVGKGSDRAPLLIDLRWGNDAAPQVTLVGKGVCFDAGGLDLKRQPEIATMKSDMAGAALALAVAVLVMQAGLNVRLRLLIPAVDNVPSGASVRPGDVVRHRNGKTTEIANTDYEGRVLLADALALASEDGPALLIDFATLTATGLGPEIAACFALEEETAAAMLRAAAETHDAICRLPLHGGYRPLIAADAADLTNFPPPDPAIPTIAAALFLREFVPAGIDWLHFDFEGWNPMRALGRPYGGNINGLRAVWRMLERRFG